MKRLVIIALLVVAMLFVLAGVAAVVFFAVNGGFTSNNPFDTRNIASKLEESKTLKIDSSKPLSVKVLDDAGAVTIIGAEVDNVQIKVVKTGYDSTQARADEEVKGIKYTVEQTGNAVTLRYELPKSVNIRNRVNTVDFIVTVPNQTNVNIENSTGDVNISDIEGEVVTQTAFGETNVDNIAGAVSITTNGGTVTATGITADEKDINLKSDFGSITLEQATGNNITVDTNSGTLKLREVTASGKITTSSEFGEVTFENGSADSLEVDTNSGGISLTKLTVEKDIHVENEFGNIELNQALASAYDLHTNSGDISVDGAQGTLTADTEFGGIQITDADSVTLDLRTNSGTVTFDGSLGAGPHTVRSEFGAIDLTLPADSKLNVDLKTEFGKIKSDLPITIMVTESSKSDADQIVGNINGGGDSLTVETNNGDVSIHVVK